jgi:hypothetical protein
VVAEAVAAEDGPSDALGRDLADGLPTWKRELVAGDFELVGRFGSPSLSVPAPTSVLA